MVFKRFFKKVEKDQKSGAKRAVLQELFNDLNSSRSDVYKMNFFRGLFFGVGSVLGGSVVIALLLIVLNWLTDIPGGVGDFVQFVVDSVESSGSTKP